MAKSPWEKLMEYHTEAMTVIRKYMVQDLTMCGGRPFIPSDRYPDFLKELEPIWEKHFGPWDKRKI